MNLFFICIAHIWRTKRFLTRLTDFKWKTQVECCQMHFKETKAAKKQVLIMLQIESWYICGGFRDPQTDQRLTLPHMLMARLLFQLLTPHIWSELLELDTWSINELRCEVLWGIEKSVSNYSALVVTQLYWASTCSFYKETESNKIIIVVFFLYAITFCKIKSQHFTIRFVFVNITKCIY